MDASKFDVSNFIPMYPDVKDENFSVDILKKAEFYGLRLESSEQRPDRKGGLLQSQKILQRFFSPHTQYKNCLFVHDPGTGKTCLSSAIIEAGRAVLTTEGKRRKRALVIVKNDGLRRKYMKDVANVCTSGVYEPKPTAEEIRKGREMTEEAELRRLKTEITKTYEIVTIEKFISVIRDMKDPMIKALYSNRDIIIDEAHILRIQTSTKGGDGVEADEPKISSEMYDVMDHFLHVIDDCRILLFTGTPIWDDVSEIASLMNLILGYDEKLPTGKEFVKKFFDSDGNLKAKGIDILKEKFKGKISYLRKMITTAVRDEVGVTKPWLDYIKVFPDRMSKEQAAYVRKAWKSEEGKGRVFSRDAREASNMIIPMFDSNGNIDDYDYGKGAFQKYAITKKTDIEGKKTSTSYKITNPHLSRYIKNHLADIAAKFASVIEDIKAHPNEITFIYNEFVSGTGGAIMLALCMEIHGFVWVKSSSQIATKSDRRRFAVITSDKETTHQPTQIEALLNSSNKPDNKYGDRLQVIIGSEKIALGLDIFNVRRIHVLTPYWNMPSLEQAIARGFRFGGHDALPKEERHIKIFKHVAVEKGKDALEVGYPTSKGFSDYQTIDIHVYNLAEKKEFKNTQIYRVLKEVAFDCGLFYKRNVLKNDIDGTRDCDYQKCQYKCDALPRGPDPDDPYALEPEELDYTTYNLFYADEDVKKMVSSIVELFQNYFSLDLYAIKRLLGEDDGGDDGSVSHSSSEYILIKALDIIIDSRIAIRDRYGFERYLKEDGNVYFLDSTTSDATRYMEVTYVESPLVTEYTPLEHLVDIMEFKEDAKTISRLCKTPTEEEFENISYKSKIVLLEEAYGRSISGRVQTPVEKFILDQLGNEIYVTGDGLAVHILQSTEFKGTSFDIAAKRLKKIGDMRYFDTEELDWKNMIDEDKEKMYLEEIKMMEDEANKLFEGNTYDVYGIISKKDKKFRVRLKPEPGKRTTGLVCTSFEESDLRDIFVYNLKKFPTPKKEYEVLSKDRLVKIISGIPGSTKYRVMLAKKSEKYLRGLLTILTLSKTDLCSELRKLFKKLDILYEK